MYSAINRLTLCIAACYVCPGAQAAAPGRIDDPVFGLSYSIQRVHFESAPPALANACREVLTNANWDRRLFIYAHNDSSGTEYYVLGGYYVRRNGANTGTSTVFLSDPKGALVRLQGGHCSPLGPARESFDSRPQEITSEQLDLLAADAVQRYRKAFGGAQKFKSALVRQKSLQALRPDHPLTRALQQP